MPALWRRIDPAGKPRRAKAGADWLRSELAADRGRGPGRPPKSGKKASTFANILYIVPVARRGTRSRKERNI